MTTAALLLLLQAASTLVMVGLIWFVQVVHYPLMAKVGEAGFVAYERAHVRRTSWVVVPAMTVELVTALALPLHATPAVPLAEGLLGLGLLAGVWASTFFLQVPEHERLVAGFEGRSHARLVRTNALRTALWSARGGLVLCWLARSLAATPGPAGWAA